MVLNEDGSKVSHDYKRKTTDSTHFYRYINRDTL